LPGGHGRNVSKVAGRLQKVQLRRQGQIAANAYLRYALRLKTEVPLVVMNVKKLAALGVVVMLGMSASACLFFFNRQSIKAPNAQVTALKYSATSLTGAKLNVGFNLKNQNPTPLVIESFVYDLSLNGTALGKGSYLTRVELAASAEQKVTSLLDLGAGQLSANVQSLLQQGSVQAKVHCKFYLSGGETRSYTGTADVSVEK
jgi:LEA14-like dessication related protein